MAGDVYIPNDVTKAVSPELFLHIMQINRGLIFAGR